MNIFRSKGRYNTKKYEGEIIYNRRDRISIFIIERSTK